MPPARPAARIATTLVLVATAACDHPTPVPTTAEPEARTIAFEASAATFSSVDVSPDGKTVLFDLLGTIYTVPITGGRATALTDGWAWQRAPRYSPDGTRIAMVRDGDGPDEIWTMAAAGGSFQQITDHSGTRGGWVGGSPAWSPDGRRIVYGEFDPDDQSLPLSLVDVATKQTTSLEPKRPIGMRHPGVLSPDGASLYFTERDTTNYSAAPITHTFIVKLDLASQTRTVLTDLTAGNQEFVPELSRDGKQLAFVRRTKAGSSSLMVRDLASKTERMLLPLPQEDEPFRWDDTDERPRYNFTPDGQHIVIGAGGDIHRVRVSDGADATIAFAAPVSRLAAPLTQARTGLPDGPVPIHGIQWPRLSRDGKTLVFGAVGYLWRQDLPNGAPRRLTEAGPDEFEFMPALSPDGKDVAYVTLTKKGHGVTPGRLVRRSLDNPTVTTVLADSATYLAPVWSPDGSKLAFVRDLASHSSFGWVDARGGPLHLVAPVQEAQRETWGRLVAFSKDGQRLIYSWEHDPLGQPDSTEMREVPLAGGQSRLLAMGGRDTRGMIPSPDGKHALVMGIDDDLWLLRLSADGTPVRGDLADSNLTRITTTGAEFVDWQSDSSFIYAYGNRLYRHAIGAAAPTPLATIGFTYPRFQGTGLTAITGARIITVSGDSGAGRVIDQGTLIINGRRIEAVGPSSEVKVPAGARVIDGTGLTLMPAIGDMHYHSQGGTNLLSKMIMSDGELGLRESVPYGVTMGWQPGGPTRNSGGLDLAELQQTGRVPGPRWINAPWSVNMVSYGQNSAKVMSSYPDALRSAQHRAELGATVLKEYMTKRRDHRRWFAQAARETGVGIVSHVEGLDMVLSRATDGYTGTDHPNFAVPVYDDVRQYLARTGLIWTPNIGITWGTEGMSEDANRAFVREVFHRWPDQIAKWKATHSKALPDTMPPKRPLEQTRTLRVAKAAAYLMAGGVKIGISAHNPPGLMTHAELWFLQQAGAPRGGILRAATRVGAEKMGLDRELGSLEPGKVADLLVLTANPLDDILNTLAIKYVLADGVLYDPTGAVSNVR